MNTDLIFDAMDYIDDDMLEDVDALRTKRNVKPKLTWMRYASVAACVCIIIGAVYLVERTGLLDSVEVADGIKQENEMSGESLIHNYVRADIITSDNDSLSVTDYREVTAIFDILYSNFQSESAADDKLYSENDKDPADEKTDGSFAPENAGGVIVQPEYTITLVSVDGSKKVYTLSGRVVYNENSGETFMLRDDQYNELMEILDVK